ncbi:MAG: TonB-dependent receptor [Bryobacterales bacterium]|nr:TonB-dependent receptor [Bryobacterales bacterium]
MTRLLSCFILLACAAFSQTTGTATLVGTVTDQSGSVIAAAKVTVVNTETSFTSTGQTNENGGYYIPYLRPGSYRLGIEAAGFKRFEQSGIVLRLGETPRVNVQLELGSVTESITITAAPPLLETETSTAGAILEGNTVVKTPVMQKRAYALTLYLPGVNNLAGMSVLGQRQRSMGYTIDGVSGKEPVRGQVYHNNRTMSTSTDALQEVKLITTGMPAEFGHSGSGVLTAVFKSGANQLHGAAEDRWFDARMMHRQYFDTLKPKGLSYHEISAMGSGPVYLPKIYNGKDRTFFLFSYQRHHEQASETSIVNTPSLEMMGGDFNFGGLGYPIYDPLSTRQDASGKWIRDPFPDKRIPQSRFDPVARKFLGYQPFEEPNAPGDMTTGGPVQNLYIASRYQSYRSRFDTKIDHQFSAMHKIYARYSHNRHRTYSKRPSAMIKWDVLNGEIVPTPTDMGNLVVSDIYTLSPTLINEVRLGFTRRRYTRAPESAGQDWAGKLGIPNVGGDTFPDFRNSGGSVFYSNMGPGGVSQEVGEDITFQENLTKVAGRHTFKMGYELVRTRFNSLSEALPSGRYRMGGTNMPYTPNTGNDFAAFLLGSVVRADFTQTMASWLPRWWHHAFYFQDDYKPAPNLTVNLGLRWSYESPFQTKYGQQSQFDPSVVDPISGMKGAIVHGKGPLAARDLNNFQPRVGLAWNFRPNLVFRGSFGLMTIDLLTDGINQNFEEYFATAVVQPPVGDPRIAFRLSQGPPTIPFNTAADGSVPFVGTNFSGRTASWYDPSMRMPYLMTWSGGFQYQFSRSWLAEFMYQGSAGVGLLNNWNTNVVPLDISRDVAVLDRIYEQGQNYKPYPQFGSVNHYSNYGHTTYHGATWRVEKRYSSGLTVNAFYTFSKALDDSNSDSGVSGITYYNRRLEKGRSNFDVNHRVVALATYELPFGQGRAFMNTGGWKNFLLGGWNVTWIQSMQTGPPLTVSFSGSPYRYLPGSSRPIQVLPNDRARTPDWQIGPHRFPASAQNPYLNIDAFQYPAAYQPGTLGRNTITAPGIIWPQSSLSKEWSIRERARFILRWDINNLFKHPSFSSPNSTYNPKNASTFGRITGTRANFDTIGCRFHHVLVVRVEW